MISHTHASGESGSLVGSLAQQNLVCFIALPLIQHSGTLIRTIAQQLINKVKHAEGFSCGIDLPLRVC